ncbi:ATP-binding protein [Streptomyces sp. NPDC059649]|uniref:ATP-binding protein n=1 Tax=Streptomyces sp. NPDC059649 TaxID=3346895 RepID=UPI0036BF0238
MPDAIKRFFAPVPESVGQARDFVVRTLAAWDLEGRADDVRLCVSELATNALAHDTRRGHGYGFHVAMSAEDDIVRIEVHDSNPHRPRRRRPTNDDVSGRGLHIVDAFSDDWGVEDRGATGKVVWSRFKTAPATQGAPC